MFFPYTAFEQEEDLTASITSFTHTKPSNSRRDPLIVGASVFIAVFVVAIVSIATVSTFPGQTQLWADILGTISGGLAAVQYLPQIYHTWAMKDMKSLSVTTLSVQAPGSFLFALSLALRVGAEGWSTWMVYCVTGLLQFVLLGMAINFELRDRRERQSQSPVLSGASGLSTGAETDGADERTPLIREVQGNTANGSVRD